MCKAKALWNHKHCLWFSFTKKTCQIYFGKFFVNVVMYKYLMFCINIRFDKLIIYLLLDYSLFLCKLKNYFSNSLKINCATRYLPLFNILYNYAQVIINIQFNQLIII